MNETSDLKIAIFHHWWVTNRGGEKVLEAMLEVYPNADIYIHVGDDDLIKNSLPNNFSGKIFKTFISKFPFAKKLYKLYLPLMPLALEQMDFSNYDVVVSIESGPSKGAITGTNTVSICYCNTPMRYIWDQYHHYLKNSNKIIRILFPLVSHWLRVWDKTSADRVDYFISNSNYIKKRVRKFYRRESTVVFPPVSLNNFQCGSNRGDFYLFLGQLTSYKMPQLAVEAFNSLGLPLVVIGEGELYNKLKTIANPANITLLGRQPFPVVKNYLETCKALIFPGIEDFGIVPVEAVAAGAPVIAYAEGGVLDTIVDGLSGIYFYEQTTQSIISAVNKFETIHEGFDREIMSESVQKFDKSKFKIAFSDFLVKSYIDFNEQ